MSAEVAEVELFDMLVYLKLTYVLSAKQCCVLAFWASKSGSSGGVQKLAVKPDAQSGKFSKRFDDAVGSKPNDSSDLYSVSVGRRVRYDATRVFDAIPICLPHECLVKELSSSSAPVAELKQALELGELPPAYLNHPGVTGPTRDPCAPI